MRAYTYPATFKRSESGYIVSFPDFGSETEVDADIVYSCKEAERVLSDLICDRLSRKEDLPQAYSDAEKFKQRIVTKVTVHIPELSDACRIVCDELARKEFFYNAFVSSVRSAINDTLNRLDADTDTILVDDIAEAVVERIGGMA